MRLFVKRKGYIYLCIICIYIYIFLCDMINGMTYLRLFGFQFSNEVADIWSVDDIRLYLLQKFA